MKYLCYDSALNEAYTLVQLMKRYPQNISLFAGTDDEGIWESAPWLFEIRDNFYDLQGQPLIQLNRSVVFETNETMKEVCDYLHTKMYQNLNGELTYYRIWDAAILVDYLKNAPTIDRDSFFQVFQSFFVESDQNTLLKWTNSPQGITATPISKSEALPYVIEKEIETQEDTPLSVQRTAEEIIKVEKGPIKEEEKQIEQPKKRKFFLD